jgi:hypothetical protein
MMAASSAVEIPDVSAIFAAELTKPYGVFDSVRFGVSESESSSRWRCGVSAFVIAAS